MPRCSSERDVFGSPVLWAPAICGSFFEAGGDNVACVCALCVQENICLECPCVCEHLRAYGKSTKLSILVCPFLSFGP